MHAIWTLDVPASLLFSSLTELYLQTENVSWLLWLRKYHLFLCGGDFDLLSIAKLFLVWSWE